LSGCRDDAWAPGILFSQSRLMEIPETKLLQGALLAIDDVNAAGGAWAARLKRFTTTRGSDLALYHRYADRLLTEDVLCADGAAGRQRRSIGRAREDSASRCGVQCTRGPLESALPGSPMRMPESIPRTFRLRVTTSPRSTWWPYDERNVPVISAGGLLQQHRTGRGLYFLLRRYLRGAGSGAGIGVAHGFGARPAA
jgi:Periplasmic binding protein domain